VQFNWKKISFKGYWPPRCPDVSSHSSFLEALNKKSVKTIKPSDSPRTKRNSAIRKVFKDKIKRINTFTLKEQDK
jgi:hypothetical protein